MRVVNLFAGEGTWAKPWQDRGHTVWKTDIEPFPGVNLVTDILDLRLRDIPWGPGEVDAVLASPDCTAFSKGSIGKHWGGGYRAYIPKTDKAHNRMALVFATASIIEALRPKVAVIENPVGMLRKLQILDRYERRTVWYCHYDDVRAKPTDLWGAPFPKHWRARPECHYRYPSHPSTCCCYDHEAAPRGAKTGTQGLEKQARSHMPYSLSESICIATEWDI
jgi:hypothetical protein